MRLNWSVLCLVFIVACQQANIEKSSFCNPPYFEWQQGQCCLDVNTNKICDEHESVSNQIKKEPLKQPSEEIVTQTEEPPEELVNEAAKIVPSSELQKELMQQLIDKAPKSYLFSNLNDNTGALVVGDKRSDGYVEYEFALFLAPMSWDMKTKRILMTAPMQIDERWYNMKHNLPAPKSATGQVKYFPTYFEMNLTGDPEVDLNIIPKELRKYYWSANMENKVQSPRFRGDRLLLIYFDSFYTKGPVDMMKEYSLEKPTKIDTKPKVVSSAGKQITSNLSISFNKKEDPSKTLVFIFDPTLSVPVLIEEQNELGQVTKRTEYDVQTTVTYHGKKNTPISENFVEPLPDYIIITPSEYDEYKEATESGSWSEYFKNRSS